MLESKLSTRRKWACVILSLLLMGQGVFLGYVAFGVKVLPLPARLGFIVGVIFSFCFAGFLLLVVKKGVYNLKSHPTVLTGMTWGFAVIFMVIIMFFGLTLDPVRGSRLMDYGLFIFIMAAVFLILSHIRKSELTTREKLLEIEYRIAKITEEE